MSKPTNPVPKQWTPEEIDYLKQHYPTKHNRELAALFDVSINVIRHKAVQLGITKDSLRYTRLGRGKSNNLTHAASPFDFVNHWLSKAWLPTKTKTQTQEALPQ